MSLDRVQSFLTAIDFPASKDDIIRQAEREGADEEVLRALRALPVAEYENRAELNRSLDTVEATGQSVSAKAARARTPSRSQQGVAQHERTYRS